MFKRWHQNKIGKKLKEIEFRRWSNRQKNKQSKKKSRILIRQKAILASQLD